MPPEKSALREKIKKELRNIPPSLFCSRGEGASRLLSSAPVWFRYKTLFLFLSADLEIDTRPLLTSALKAGKKVFAPKIDGKRLVFFSLSSPDGPWRSGPYGIREPLDGEAAAAKDFPALIIAPGLAFDKEGNRLGRGGGYYDRFFAELDEAGAEYAALGFCMDFQLFNRIPAEEHDKKMNGVLTEKELLELFDNFSC